MKKYRLLVFAVFLLYVTYLAAKNVYTSEIIEIVRHFGVSKSDASAAASFSFVSYAIVQVLFVKIIKRLNVNRYLLICSPISAALYALVPFCTDIRQVWVIFAIEGGLMAGVVPVCMLVISEYLPDELVPAANRYTGAAFALSFVLDYFFSALFLRIADFRLGFFVFPAMYMITVIFFCRILSACPRREREVEKKENVAAADRKAVFRYLFFAGMTGLLVNMIYYAVSGWIPNLLSEQFGLTPALSVFITLFIPLTGAAGSVFCLWLCGKYEFRRTTVILAAASAALCAVLSGVYRAAFVLTLALVVTMLFIVRGVAHVFGWQVPINAKRIMDPAAAATVINIFSCVGAAIGPVVFGALAEKGDYAMFFAAAAASAAVMAALAFAGRKSLA